MLTGNASFAYFLVVAVLEASDSCQKFDSALFHAHSLCSHGKV